MRANKTAIPSASGFGVAFRVPKHLLRGYLEHWGRNPEFKRSVLGGIVLASDSTKFVSRMDVHYAH